MMHAKIMHHLQRRVHSIEHGQTCQLCTIFFRTLLKVDTHAPFPVISPGRPSPIFWMSLF